MKIRFKTDLQQAASTVAKSITLGSFAISQSSELPCEYQLDAEPVYSQFSEAHSSGDFHAPAKRMDSKDVSIDEIKVELPPAMDKWTEELEARYQKLLKKSIFDECSEEEQAEYQGLEVQRDRNLFIPTPEEVAQELRQRRIFREAIKALDECIKYQKAAT